MSELFDDFSRMLGSAMPRREVFRICAAAMAGTMWAGRVSTRVIAAACGPSNGTVPCSTDPFIVAALQCLSLAHCCGDCCCPATTLCCPDRFATGLCCSDLDDCCSEPATGGFCCSERNAAKPACCIEPRLGPNGLCCQSKNDCCQGALGEMVCCSDANPSKSHCCINDINLPRLCCKTAVDCCARANGTPFCCSDDDPARPACCGSLCCQDRNDCCADAIRAPFCCSARDPEKPFCCGERFPDLCCETAFQCCKDAAGIPFCCPPDSACVDGICRPFEEVAYSGGGGGTFVDRRLKRLFRISVSGLSDAGDVGAFLDTTGIAGSLRVFNYSTRTLIESREFSLVQGTLSNGNVKLSGFATAAVNGAVTDIVFETARTNGIVTFEIRHADTAAILARGTGEAGLATLELIITP